MGRGLAAGLDGLTKPQVLSLFSGVGGLDLGLEAAGMEVAYQCEWDKRCVAVLRRHWPTVPRWGDIATLTGQHILEHAPTVDVVAWGSPCQNLSVAGSQIGLAGEKSALFHEGIRIIRELREASGGRFPRLSVWENVAGALSSNRGADFGIVLDTMADAGAVEQEWRVLDARYFGVAQRRRRVFLISIFDPSAAERCPEPLLPVAQSGCWHARSQHPERCATSRSAGTGAEGNDQQPFVKIVRPGERDEDGDVPREVWAEREIAPTLTTFDVGEVRTPIMVAVNGATPLVRRPTPIEYERLNGWPDDWTAGQPDLHRYIQCGNGVASPVAEWIGDQLMPVLQG